MKGIDIETIMNTNIVLGHVRSQNPGHDRPITSTGTAVAAVHQAAPAVIAITEICTPTEMVCHRFMVAMTNINREVKNSFEHK